MISAPPARRLTAWRDALAIATRGDVAAFSGRARAGFDLALYSGGDERVFIDPATARTKYGTPHGCAEDEVWVSSSTASAISPRGYAASAGLWQSLVSGEATLIDVFDSIRARLTEIFGIAGTQTILAGSGTEAALVSLVVTRMTCAAHLTAIIVGAAETGRGVAAAAAGLHFLRHAAFADVVAGERLAGLEGTDIQVDTIGLRTRSGQLRDVAEIDAELAQKVERARRAGRDVIIHRLEASKTGHSAPSLAVLAALCAAQSGHVFVLADACQLRCSAAHVKSLLQSGFLVSLTGSKFAGGPSFAGALLVPLDMIARLRPMPLPEGLAAYSAQLDWSPDLRKQIGASFLPFANIGLGLRWRAALAEIEQFFACPADVRDAVFAQFHAEVTKGVANTACLDLMPAPMESAEIWGHTIFCIAMRHADGRLFGMEEAVAVQRILREGAHGAKRFHLGQPVAVGEAGVLRVAASAPLANLVAEGLAVGLPFAKAFAPIAEDLRALFTAWPAAMAEFPATSVK